MIWLGCHQINKNLRRKTLKIEKIASLKSRSNKELIIIEISTLSTKKNREIRKLLKNQMNSQVLCLSKVKRKKKLFQER